MCFHIPIHNHYKFICYASYSHVFWVDASSSKTIELALKGIAGMSVAQDFGVDGSAQSVLLWISSIKEGWLMVFDDANDLSPEAVANFFPSGNRGNILITS